MIISIIFLTVLLSTSTMNNSYYKYNDNGRIIIPNQDVITNLPLDGGEYWNRLIFEKSPYLLQHAANPVDWYPWGEEAFELAKKLDKPIFLSIGYTTCHWCHVMEHESFEDSEVAQLMNDTFINVKVDREERPDIDNVYMQVTQMMNGRGGWPMTVVMTPDKEPFFTGTYFPKKSKPRYSRIGMMELVPKINELWTQSRDSLVEQSSIITSKLKNIQSSMTSNQSINKNILDNTFKRFSKSYDKVFGGFGRSPKFPRPHDYSFLVRYFLKTKTVESMEMVEHSLYKMRYGGIYDQIGYGFHRYSVDEKWLVPHFEKMLYDQAMLIHAYLDAYIATEDKFYINVVQEIIQYVKRDMTAKEGGFYSAEDADSEGEEGIFYIWNSEELKQVLDKNEYEFIKDLLSIKDNGNCVVEGHRTNILNIDSKLADKKLNKNISLYNSIREKIFNYREKRVHPQKDDKILTDWNGLMISALSRASAIMQNEDYKQLAIESMDFILKNLKQSDNKLFKRYRQGESSIDGMIEDYSFLIWGLIELYQITFDIDYLREAQKLSDYQIKNFWDEDNKGFYFYDINSEGLIVRPKEIYDGAIPSGNSVSAYNFLRLSKILNNNQYKDIADQTMNAFGGQINRSGSGYTMMLHAVDYDFGPSYEVIIVGEANDKRTQSILNEVYNSKNLNKIIILIDPSKKDETIELIPFSEFYFNTDTKEPKAYICKNYTCDLPTSDLNLIKQQLEK